VTCWSDMQITASVALYATQLREQMAYLTVSACMLREILFVYRIAVTLTSGYVLLEQDHITYTVEKGLYRQCHQYGKEGTGQYVRQDSRLNGWFRVGSNGGLLKADEVAARAWARVLAGVLTLHGRLDEVNCTFDQHQGYSIGQPKVGLVYLGAYSAAGQICARAIRLAWHMHKQRQGLAGTAEIRAALAGAERRIWR
jgi:hypothetical protein